MKNYKDYMFLIVGLIVVVGMLFRKRMSTTNEYTDGYSLPSENSSLSAESAQQFAEMLYQAMARVGTDVDTIKKVFANLGGISDYNRVHNAFGVRPYGTFGAPLYSWFPSTNLNLLGWLKAELSDADFKSITKNVV